MCGIFYKNEIGKMGDSVSQEGKLVLQGEKLV